MFRRIILGIVVLAIGTGLIYGGVYRTIARTETEKKQISQKEIYRSARENQRKATRKGKGKIA